MLRPQVDEQAPAEPAERRAARWQAVALALAGGLVVLAAVVGALLRHRGVLVHASAAPLFAVLRPHVGLGTLLAPAVAVLVIARGPRWAERLAWGRLLLLGWALAVAWTIALALSEGWSRGVATPLAAGAEYLVDVPRVTSLGGFLGGFAQHIVNVSDAWTTHVAGHPPGALLLFVGLDRIGLGGSSWAAVSCVLAGASSVAAVAIAVRALCGEATARRVLPFAVLAPSAIWVGASADAVFLAVSAWGVTALAVACSRPPGPRSDAAAVTAGVLLGVSAYLSYGLVVIAPVVLGVVVVTRRWRPLVVAGVGAVGVVVLVTAGGFAWWEGYVAVHQRYLQGFGGTRPYAYWVWADLAAFAIALGPATVAGVGRAAAGARPALRAWRERRSVPEVGVLALVAGGLSAVLIAAVSGLSKAEVERIWLPFGAWVLVACALLPRRHAPRWLAAQALTALLVEHLFRTPW